MPKVIDKTSKSVTVKFTSREFNQANNMFEFLDEINSYELVFDKPIPMTDLLK
ncbi:MAG: hypothetical protein LBQ59_05680 [Candidatus Peribacteria bacterium]|jgi:hypothetical protein|nr:hypothetical protein [Candidatus Peribacteria bacterium]